MVISHCVVFGDPCRHLLYIMSYMAIIWICQRVEQFKELSDRHLRL